MKKADYKIEFVRGDSYSLFGRQRTQTWDAGSTSYIPGPYRDLTGWTGRADVRSDATSATILFSFTVTLGNQATAPGSFFVTAAPEDTVNLSDSELNGVWDLQWTSPTGGIITPIGGAVVLESDVTRPEVV